MYQSCGHSEKVNGPISIRTIPVSLKSHSQYFVMTMQGEALVLNRSVGETNENMQLHKGEGSELRQMDFFQSCPSGWHFCFGPWSGPTVLTHTSPSKPTMASAVSLSFALQTTATHPGCNQEGQSVTFVFMRWSEDAILSLLSSSTTTKCNFTDKLITLSHIFLLLWPFRHYSL